MSVYGELFRTSCCGCRSISDLSIYKTPEKALAAIGWDWFAIRGAFVVYTSKTRSPIGRRLAGFIKAHKLGVVTETDSSKDGVRAFMWAVDTDKFREWFTKNELHPAVGKRVRTNQAFKSYWGGDLAIDGTVTELATDWTTLSFLGDDGRTYNVYSNHVSLI